MQTRVTFRNVESNDALKDAAKEATDKFEKFSDDIISADVIFNNDNKKFAEFTVHVKGDTLVAKEGTDDFIKSLNEGGDKIIRQIRKRKEKMQKK